MPLATSYVPRPTSMAPVAAMTSGNASADRYSATQSIAWPGPAMKPSSDIALFTTTLPVPVATYPFSRRSPAHVEEIGVTDAIAATLDRLRTTPEAVLDHIPPDGDVVVGRGQRRAAHGGRRHRGRRGAARGPVRLHQMLPMRDRGYIDGQVPGLRHVSWFLSPHSREAFHRGDCDLVPNSFSEMPRLLRQAVKPALVVTAVSPPDRHGYFSLAANAEYAAALIGEVPFFVEVNPRLPRTFGGNQLHVSDLVGFCEADYAPAELPAHAMGERDRTIAGLVAERIPDGATLQAGIGAVPDCVLGLLGDHKELGVHTELLGDGMIDLVENGVITGTEKATHRNKIVTTTALGSARLYDFVADNPGVEFWPVEYTNAPTVIAREPHFTAINATVEVDFLGQCASEGAGQRLLVVVRRPARLRPRRRDVRARAGVHRACTRPPRRTRSRGSCPSCTRAPR